jgi:SOS-response transcriptional repressor LexA
MGFPEQAKLARKKAGLSQQEVAKLLGVQQTYISMIERGERSLKTNPGYVAQLEKAYGLKPGDLARFLPEDHTAQKLIVNTIDCLGVVAAGPEFTSPDECVPEQIILHKRYPKDAFALKVSGHSVSKFGVLDGDLIIVKPTKDPVDGTMIVIRQNGGYTLKGFVDGVVLAYSELTGPKMFELEEGAEIIGVLLETCGPRFVQAPKKMRKKRIN